MVDFQILYDYSQFQEFRHLIDDVLATMKPTIQPFVGLPKEMKVQFKHNPEMYPDEEHVQLVTEIVSGLTQLFMNRYESITDFSLEINF